MARAGWPQAGGTDVTRAPAWVAVSAPPFWGRLKLKRPRYKANSVTFGQTLNNSGGFSLQHLDAAVRPRDGAGEAQSSDGARRGWVCCAQDKRVSRQLRVALPHVIQELILGRSGKADFGDGQCPISARLLDALLGTQSLFPLQAAAPGGEVPSLGRSSPRGCPSAPRHKLPVGSGGRGVRRPPPKTFPNLLLHPNRETWSWVQSDGAILPPPRCSLNS